MKRLCGVVFVASISIASLLAPSLPTVDSETAAEFFRRIRPPALPVFVGIASGDETIEWAKSILPSMTLPADPSRLHKAAFVRLADAESLYFDLPVLISEPKDGVVLHHYCSIAAQEFSAELVDMVACFDRFDYLKFKEFLRLNLWDRTLPLDEIMKERLSKPWPGLSIYQSMSATSYALRRAICVVSVCQLLYLVLCDRAITNNFDIRATKSHFVLIEIIGLYSIITAFICSAFSEEIFDLDWLDQKLQASRRLLDTVDWEDFLEELSMRPGALPVKAPGRIIEVL